MSDGQREREKPIEFTQLAKGVTHFGDPQTIATSPLHVIAGYYIGLHGTCGMS